MLIGRAAGTKSAFPRWLKWAVYALAVAICLFVALYVLLASGLTNAALKNRLEVRLSQWSGLSVRSNGVVSLGFFPPRATLSEVKVDSSNTAFSMEAVGIAVSFSWLSLIANDPVMREVELSDARIEIHAGSLLQSIGFLKSGTAPGTIRFDNTNLSVLWPTGRRDEIRDLSGTFRWATLNGAARLSASGNWQNETARLEASSDEPLKLLSGGESAIALQFKSAPMLFDYSGKVAFPGVFLAEGSMKAKAPSLGTVLGWFNVTTAMPSDQGALDLEASLSHADGKVTLNDLTMAFGGIPANGILVLDPSPATPLVSGTLAFEKADLGSLVAAFQPAAQDATGRKLDLDLRFSAETVETADFTLENAAGTIKVNGNDTLLDLGSSRFAGGECVGSLKFSGPAGQRIAAVRLSMRDVVADQLTTYDPSLPMLSAPLSAQIEATGSFDNWAQFTRQAVGAVKLSVGEGVVRNFSTDTLASHVSGGSVFALTDTYAGLSPVVTGNVNALVSSGAVIITEAEMKFASHQLFFSGAVPLLSGGVALNGRIVPAGDQPAGLPFFIGGTWVSPFVTMRTKGQ
jgi:AsmA protein